MLFGCLFPADERQCYADDNADGKGDRVYKSGTRRCTVPGVFSTPKQIAVVICYDSTHGVGKKGRQYPENKGQFFHVFSSTKSLSTLLDDKYHKKVSPVSN